MNFDDYLKETLRSKPEVRREYERLEPEYKIIGAVIGARIERKMTRAYLADALEKKLTISFR